MLEISRRGVVLNAAGALAAFGLNAPVAFIGAARAQGVDDLFRRHKVGDIEITSLVDGYLEAPHREGWIRNASVEQAKAALRA